MNINAINSSSSQVSFGYSNILKTLFKEGEMPSVQYGLYGNPINKANVSLEHLQPHSKGGRSVLSNFALADKNANSARGNKPLAAFLDKEMLDGYLAQFNFQLPGKFNGLQYQRLIRETCDRLNIPDKLPEVPKEIIVPKKEILKAPAIDYGNLKEVIAHLDEIDLGLLSKKMLKALKNRGYI